ncbi:MAG: hypothetical protein WCG31_06990 [Deltaproteobacteria bacterium]
MNRVRQVSGVTLVAVRLRSFNPVQNVPNDGPALLFPERLLPEDPVIVLLLLSSGVVLRLNPVVDVFDEVRIAHGDRVGEILLEK